VSFFASQFRYIVKGCTSPHRMCTTAMVKSVLIADDNALIRQGLCELFSQEAGFEVCGEAENGKRAIEEAQELHPDLILLDLFMPVMNGLDGVRALTRLMPEVPVIMYSAYSDSFTEREAHSAGYRRWSQSLRTSLSCSAKHASWSMRLPLDY